MGYNLDELPAKEVELKKEDGLQYYSQMQDIRSMEQACSVLYKERLIKGHLCLYTGQVSKTHITLFNN